MVLLLNKYPTESIDRQFTRVLTKVQRNGPNYVSDLRYCSNDNRLPS